MLKLKYLMLLFLIIPIVASTKDASGQFDVSPVLFLSCTQCRINSNLVLTAGIKNEGERPVNVYSLLGWGNLAGLVFHVEDSMGKEIVSKELDDTLIVPSTLGDRSYYDKLFRGHSLLVSLNIPMKSFFKKYGTYKIWVVYRSPVPQSSSLLKENFLSYEDGPLVSSKVTIIISP